MNKKILFLIILLIINAAYYLPIMKSPLAPYDEGVIIVGAERVMKGQVPYKDFLTVYGPAQIYTLAALFKTFGITTTVERIYDIAIKSLLSLFIFLIIRLLSSNKTAIVGWIMSLVWIEYSYFHAYPVYPAILFTFICIYCLLLHMKQDNLFYVVLGAVSMVCAILFRHDLGGLAAVAIALVLLLQKIMGRQKSWSPLICYIATGVITAMPAIIYFVVASDIEAIFNDLILIPLDMVGTQQRLPYPPLSRYNLPFFVFPFVLLAGVITFFISLKGKMGNTVVYGILLISLVGIVFINQLWGRSDTIHLLPVALAGILLAPILFHVLSSMLSLNSRLYWVFFVLFIITFAITLSKPINKKMLFLPNNYNIAVVNPDIERAKYPFIPQDYKKVVSYIKKYTSKDDYIYVGVKNHDQFVFNDAIFYFLSERKSATKYHELNPGHTTTLEIQEEMVEEIRTTSTRLIVLAERYRKEANPSGIDTKIDLLDNYIFNNYEFKEKYGLFEIWMKKDNVI